jgi:hypothetical protein
MKLRRYKRYKDKRNDGSHSWLGLKKSFTSFTSCISFTSIL